MALYHQICTIDKTRIGKLMGAPSLENMPLWKMACAVCMACELRDIAMHDLGAVSEFWPLHPKNYDERPWLFLVWHSRMFLSDNFLQCQNS